MAKALDGKRIAILATDGFEQVELEATRNALISEGAETLVVAPKAGKIQGFNHHDRGDSIPVDLPLEAAVASDFDGLVLPGGTFSPDALRTDSDAVAFVKAFARTDKPIAAICHGAWALVEADVVRDRKVTSWPSLRTDLQNAGAHWVDEAVVQDGNLITSRKPDDLPLFSRAAIQAFGRGSPIKPAN